MAVSQSLSLTESDVNTLNNTSKVRILWKSTQTGESWNGYTKPAKYYVSINGGAETEYSVNYTLPQNATETIVDRTITVTHKSDGTGSVTVRTWMNTEISAGIVTLSKSLNLTRIARATSLDSLTCATSYFTGKLTYTYTPKYADFYNKYFIYLGDAEITSSTLGKKAASQQTGTLNLSADSLSKIYNLLPNSTSGKLRFTIRTYSDSGYTQEIGSGSSKEITLSIPNNADTQPLVRMVLNPDTVISTTVSPLYISKVSRVKATFTNRQGQYGASIVSYKLTVSSKDFVSTEISDSVTLISDILPLSGLITVKGTVTDTRGYSRTFTQVIIVYSYSQPELSTLASETGYFNGEMTYKHSSPNVTSDGIFYLKCNIALNINGTYTHIRAINIGKTMGLQTGTITLTSDQLTKIYEKLTSAASGTLRFTLRTYLDSGYSEEYGGTSYKEITLKIPEDDSTRPEATFTVAPVTTLQDPFDTLYIKGKTRVTANLTSGVGKYGATPQTYTVSIGTQSEVPPLTSGYFTTAGDVTITGTVTDSRGFSRTYTQTITVIDYAAPQILPISGQSEVIAARCNSEGELDSNGTYLLIAAKRSYSKVMASNVQKNYCKIQYRYKVEGGSYSSWVDILAKTASSDEVVLGAVPNVTLDTLTTYVVQIRAIDDIGDATSTTIFISTEKVYMHKAGSKNALGIGKYAEKENTVDVAEDWDAIFRGKVEVKGGYIPVEIPQYSDFNNLIIPNTYYARYTYVPDFVNCPITDQTTFALEVIAMGKDGQVLQRITRCSAEATVYERQYYSYKWHEWEVVNPPMVVGEEYRTTERYMGKPVYTKLIFCDTLPNTTYKLFPHGAAVKQAIRCVGQMSDGNSLPFRFNATNYVEIYAGPENVVIFAGNDKTNRSAYAQMWYVKD